MPPFVATHAEPVSFPARAAAVGTSGGVKAPRTDQVPVLHSGLVLNVKAGCEVYGEGEAARYFYKVVSGVVRTCQFLDDGRRQIDAFHRPGEMFGLETGSVHRLAAEAVSDCQVLAFPMRRLEHSAVADDRLARQFVLYALSCMERAQDHALLLGRATAAQKVIAFLLEMADREETDIVDLAMARQDIADFLGLTIETVSRTLSQLERDGLIKLVTPRRVRLTDVRALSRLHS